ncbi:MAG: HDOD domain-containing protein [Sinobacteraceae bacterium]|nr:HDOD domain-containing protein [Nevskiaceae bacterium]MBV9914264.1 HDOD domain-containing protein [Nevskiaceae bacterium]
MSTAPKTTQPAAGERENDVAFSFVQALASELSTGKIELPGFPHIVMRVQKVLADENADVNRIVRVLGGEPILASQIVRMANSAALNPGGAPVSDLRAAVSRVGLDTVRSATIAFAVRQLRDAPLLKGMEAPLGELWQRSVLTASLSCVIARRLTAVNPDTALLAGLLQGIGRLYILTRAGSYRALFADQDSYRAIEQDWHLSIAAALLENWGISEEIVQAVHESENLERDARGILSLTDVLVVGTILAEHHKTPQTLSAHVASSRPLLRLKLDAATCETFIAESARDIDSLREALG